MPNALKMLLAKSLPPKTLIGLRSIKRAAFGQEPPEVSDRRASPISNATTEKTPVPPPATLQDKALARLDANQIHAPYLFFQPDDVLILPAKEIARALTLAVMYINSADVKGDVAEFGTMGGFTARTLAAAMVFDPRHQPNQPLRKLKLFDSFVGLPEITAPADTESPHVRSGTWAPGGCKILGAAELRAMVEGVIPPERVEIHPGWFADTIKMQPDTTRFALIHFDGDLYQSTMDVFATCFERGFISRGAMICFDDWNCNEADPRYGERKAWSDLTERFGIEASRCGDYAIQSTKFIIHSYDGMKG